MQACPFQVPRYEWSSNNPRVTKCILCHDRIAQGLPTACAEACPTGATSFGDRDEMLAEAIRRIASEPDKYVQKVYGQNEVGGTSVFYISSVPFEQLGFNTKLQQTPMPQLTWNALSKIPGIVSVGGVMLFGIYWITNRRQEVREYEAKMRNESAVRNGKSHSSQAQ
jgi:formate dehydrogenase iron-sulfur subunit